MMLKKLGFEVDIADNGKVRSLDKFKHNEYQMIFAADCNTPVLRYDGFWSDKTN